MTIHSMRFRITSVAVAIVAVVLAIAGLAVVLLQRNSLTASIDQTLAQRAADVSSLLVEADTPRQLAPGSREGFAQLVDLAGNVVTATPNLSGQPPMSLPTAEGFHTVEGLAVDDDVFRVLTRHVEDGVLYVGTTFDVVTESTTALVGSLAITIPVVVAVLGVVTWLVVGRTLRPVEDIRSEVAAIGATELHRRVPSPGTRDEIDLLAKTMNQMLERLEDSVHAQQRFVADASHELRSPLTRLRTELEVGLREDVGDRMQLQSLLVEVVAMQEMVEDLLYLARADATDRPIKGVALDLDDVVLREADRLRAAGRVTIDASGVSGGHVVGDRGQLSRAVKNLLDNAERHALSEMVLSLEETDGMAVLRVADDGPGIGEADAQHIFERFSRVDQARGASTGGTGLGLAITSEIVSRHGGVLRLVNAGQPGAVFEMCLPAAEI